MKPQREELSDLQLRMVYPGWRIEAENARLAEEISADYAGRELIVIAVMMGAIFFAVDLVRLLKIPLLFDSVQLASYKGNASTGEVRFIKDVSFPVFDRDVLIVEDIIDTGLSLNFLVKELQKRGARTLRVCTLIDKQEQRSRSVTPDYVGLVSSGGFLVGYGLDLDGRFRELPDIYEMITDTCSGGHNDRPV